MTRSLAVTFALGVLSASALTAAASHAQSKPEGQSSNLVLLKAGRVLELLRQREQLAKKIAKATNTCSCATCLMDRPVRPVVMTVTGSLTAK